MKRFLPGLILLCLTGQALAGIKVKADRTYQPYRKIVLRAEDVTGARASFLWDVVGDCDTVEAGDTLYIWAAPGKYRVTLTAIDFESKKVERARFAFTVEGKPPEPPIPPGPNPPDPPRPPTPGPVEKLSVLIVEESADRARLPASQQSILFGRTVRTWLNENCQDWPEGKIRDWGIFDRDSDLSGYSKTLQEMMNRKRNGLPWIVIHGDGKVVHEGLLPESVSKTMELLKKYKRAAREKGR